MLRDNRPKQRNGRGARGGAGEYLLSPESVDAERKAGKKPLVEAMVGGHAPFTIPDEGLAMMEDACGRTGRGMHLHVAEDKYDVAWSHHQHHEDIIDRLGQIRSACRQYAVGSWAVVESARNRTAQRTRLFSRPQSPRSNMNNHVGYCQGLQQVENLVLGTDGCGGNMFEELKIAFFKHKDEGGPWWPDDFLTVLTRGNRILERYFNEQFGRIAPGYKADLVVLDYHRSNPFGRWQCGRTLRMGTSSNSVHSVMVEGTW